MPPHGIRVLGRVCVQGYVGGSNGMDGAAAYQSGDGTGGYAEGEHGGGGPGAGGGSAGGGDEEGGSMWHALAAESWTEVQANKLEGAGGVGGGEAGVAPEQGGPSVYDPTKPTEAADAGASAAGVMGQAPPGFVWDASVGYYHNKEHGYFYDGRTGVC